MKGATISAMAASLILVCVSAFYMAEVESARDAELWNMIYSDYSYDYYDYGPSESDELTQTGATISILFILGITFVNIMCIAKIKTMTSKVIGIIGTSLSGISLLFAVVMMTDPGASSFDEGGAVILLYGLVMIAFTVVLTVQAFKPAKGATATPKIDEID